MNEPWQDIKFVKNQYFHGKCQPPLVPMLEKKTNYTNTKRDKKVTFLYGIDRNLYFLSTLTCILRWKTAWTHRCTNKRACSSYSQLLGVNLPSVLSSASGKTVHCETEVEQPAEKPAPSSEEWQKVVWLFRITSVLFNSILSKGTPPSLVT